MRGQFILIVLISAISSRLLSVRCVPNIKIQVNNENLQKPPYLLEAIRRATLTELDELSNHNPSKSGLESASSSDTRVHSSEPKSQAERSESDTQNNGYSVVKEETIEEILDLEPDSVLRLSPESLINAIPPQDESNGANGDMLAASSNVDEDGGDKTIDSGNVGQQGRKPQLPVVSSHQKRPNVGLLDGDSSDERKLGSGAHSLVAPSVAVDETPVVNLNKRKSELADTLEPSQVMQGVSNASSVPATITRNYGPNSRTRVTLGGGYIRDKQVSQVNPDTDESSSKPIVSSSKPHSFGVPDRNIDENSRVIEIPEKIVVPISVLDNSRQPTNKLVITNNNSSQRGKLDSRCPNRGTMTLEHPTACDKYLLCEDGHLIEQTCPNGLLYGTRDMVKDYCVHRWQAVCGDKTIPNPISSPGCRWQYGIFSVQGSPRCTPDFYECIEGNFEVRKCSISGQVYDDRTKSCQFAEKVGCAEEALADFQCPPDDQANTYWPFPRYFLNDRALIHCVNDKPAIIRCRDDERVDPEHLHCVLDKSAKLENSDGLNARKAREKKKNSSN